MQIPLKTYLESIPGFFGIRLEEEPSYQIITKLGSDAEIRRYGPTIHAQTEIDGSREDAANEGFRRLASYIFGENHGNKQISMTTPVLEEDATGEQVSMTTPVLQSRNGGRWMISFILPSEFTVSTAPIPNDDRVKVVEVGSSTVATLRYSGNNTDEKMTKYSAELLELVKQSGWRPTSDVRCAQYDQPFAIPFLKRNEVQVEVARQN
jgi:hypothetical protein